MNMRRCVRRTNKRLFKLFLATTVFVVAGFLVNFFLNQDYYSTSNWDEDAADSNISVAANSGAFANDVKMAVEKTDDAEIIKLALRAAGQGIQQVYAYNITFTDRDGNEVQPNSRVKVTINPKDYQLNSERYALVHIGDDRRAKYIGNIAATNTGELSFYADSFSIYAIIPTRETDQQRYARYTYEFYVDDALVASQIVRNGDILNAPAAPNKTDYIFMGWYTENDRVFNGLNLAVDIPDSIQSDKTIKLHARFADEIFSIIFYNPQGNVLATKTGTSGDIVDTNEYRYEVSAGYFVDAWTTDSGIMANYDIDTCGQQCSIPNEIPVANSIQGDITIADHNIKLYPIVRTVQWIHFHMNDQDADSYTAASFVPSTYAFYNHAATAPPNPTRNGYTFTGWATDPAGNNMFDFSTPLVTSIDLYAIWQADSDTQYRVVFWKEALDGEGHYVEGNYEYAAYYDGTGTSGSTITVPQNRINNILSQTGLEYYELDHAETGVVLHGDGSAIVNVYLKLKVYTVSFVVETTTTQGGRTRYCFNYYNNSNNQTTSCQNTSHRSNGMMTATYVNGSTHDLTQGYSFTARMGELISDRYPGAGQISLAYTGNTFANLKVYGWRAVNNNPDNATRVSKPITMTADLLLSNGSGGATFYLIGALSTTNVEVNYWFEKADGSGYERSEDYSFTANTTGSGNFSGRQVTGYELLSNTPSGYSGSSNGVFNFYYKRNTYKLEFYNYNTPGDSHQNIRHGASLLEYDYVPERPSGMSSAFTFQGWYSTPECLDGTNFNPATEVMPMSDLMLYAKWENTNYVTLSFNSNGGSPIESQSVLYGNPGRAVEDPTRTGYTFVGWRKTDGTFFSFDNIIIEDTQLVASWVPFDTIYVEYNPNGGTLDIVDDESYVDTSTTAILPAPIEPPAGKYFVGWNVSGRIYYPGNVVMILLSDIPDGGDTITITAEWGKEVDKTSITYNPGTGVGEEHSFVLEQNEAFTTKTAEQLGYSKVGHSFVGWNTKADGSGITLKPNTQWASDQRADLPNMLYALYEINCHTLTVRHIFANGNEYDDTKTFEKCYDEPYSTSPSTKDESYVGAVTSGQASGNMPDNDIEVVYTYTKREVTVTVNHLDESGNTLASSETLTYHLDDEYTVSPSPTLTPHYNYTVDRPMTGPVTGNLTINFTYTKKSFTLTTQHQYSDGTQYDDTTTDTYQYLDSYTAHPSTKSNDYEVVNTIGSATGTIEGDVTVTFVYAKKKATITTLHLDTNGNSLAAAVTQTIDYGETYNTTPAASLIDAYNYTVDNPESGEVHGNLTVTYTYTIKTFTVTVNHIIEDAENITDTYTVEYGASCPATPKANLLAGYNYTQSGDSCTSVTQNLTVIYTYTRKGLTLTVRHLDQASTPIIADKHTGYQYGDHYETNVDMEVAKGYICTTNDTTSGTITTDTTVTFVCAKRHFNVTTHHVKIDGSPFADDVVVDYEYGAQYTALPIEDPSYTYEIIDGQANGTVSDDVEVTYRYQKNDPNLSSSVSIIDGDDTLTNTVSISEYTIKYSATVDEFLGDSVITIINKLPYPIDLDDSNLDGGVYDAEANTITWTQSVEIGSMPKSISISKAVKVVFKDIVASDRTVANRVDTTITLGSSEKTRAASASASISVQIQGRAVVHYYLKDTTNSLKDDLELIGLVGDAYTVEVVAIDGYNLVSATPAKQYLFTEAPRDIIFEYTKIQPQPEPQPEPSSDLQPEPDNPNTNGTFGPVTIAGLGIFSGLVAAIVLRASRRRA